MFKNKGFNYKNVNIIVFAIKKIEYICFNLIF